jgi:hypothetical protein
MYFDKVDVTSEADRIKILDVVAGSNHLVMKPQMVGKNAGAPMIYITARNKHRVTLGRHTEASTQLAERRRAKAGKMEEQLTNILSTVSG